MKRIECTASFKVLDSDLNNAKLLTKGKVLLKGKQGKFNKAWDKLHQAINKKLNHSEELTNCRIYWISHESQNSKIAVKNAQQLESM